MRRGVHRRRAGAGFVSVALAPEPVPAGSAERVEANLARPHTVRTLRSEGWDLDGRVDLDPVAPEPGPDADRVLETLERSRGG